MHIKALYAIIYYSVNSSCRHYAKLFDTMSHFIITMTFLQVVITILLLQRSNMRLSKVK